jgi:cytochrome c-type biogenesis protein CcmH
MSTSPNDAGVIAAAPPGGPTPTAQRPPTAGGVGGADAAVSAGAGVWLASLTFALLVAVAGYAWKGAPSLVVGLPPVAAAPARNEPMPGGMDPAQFEQLVEKLRVRLQNEPDNAEGWAMLARSYMVIGKPDEALAAFDKATTLSPQDAGLVADHANVLAQREGLAPGGKASALLDRALALDAKQPKALALAGIAAFERQDFATAVRHWEAALQVMPEHPFAPQMRDGIEQAKQAMAQLGSAPAAPGAGAAEAKGGAGDRGASAAGGDLAGGVVAGRVSLAPELAAKASPQDTVFVFARPAEGPRMPLAIVRKQVKDLPFDFRLDDTMAMSPQAKLSLHAKVVVGARISKSGNATAQAGDLQGQSEIVGVGSTGLQVRIAEEVTGPAAR